MKGFFEKLVKACPSLPFLALGVWLAWAYIAYSGTAWLSDTEMNGANISTMYIVSTLTFGIVLLASTFRAARIRQLLDRPAVVIAGGAFASLGCLVIVLIGPYYLTKVLPYDLITALFYIASACTGLGTAVVGLKCGQLYGAIAPRKAILYTALSHVAIAVIYFTVIGSPSWQPVPGGPSLAGILAFVGMPLAAAGAAALSFIAPLGEKAERGESRSRFPRSFWKLAAVTFAFSFVVVALRSMLVEVSPIDVTLDNTRLVMLLRMAMALVFAAAAIGVEGERFDFGKIYSSWPPSWRSSRSVPSLASRTLDGARSSRSSRRSSNSCCGASSRSWCTNAISRPCSCSASVTERSWRGREQDGWRACTCFRR